MRLYGCEAKCNAVASCTLYRPKASAPLAAGDVGACVKVLDVLGDAVTGAKAAELLAEAGGSPRRAVNAFFDQTAGPVSPHTAVSPCKAPAT